MTQVCPWLVDAETVLWMNQLERSTRLCRQPAAGRPGVVAGSKVSQWSADCFQPFSRSMLPVYRIMSPGVVGSEARQ
jgi:hypothetical protein